jgi:hypothetical protein
MQVKAEARRVAENPAPHDPWRRWGPYVSSRQWGTVREDYSEDGDAWGYFTHEHARSRAYRWGEDGIFGICDRDQHLCFAPTFWNGQDRMLKERFFGLTGPQGNHGEDVKEDYWYLEATPTGSWLRALYRYPQQAFPYDQLVTENARRTRHEPEYELADTGVLDGRRYFDLEVTYAKASPEDILIRITATNAGQAGAPLWILPTLWFRNRWSWDLVQPKEPALAAAEHALILARDPSLGEWVLEGAAADEVLFTENETNNELLFGSANASPFTKDAFHRHLIGGEAGAVNPVHMGTKAAAVYRRNLAPGETWTLQWSLRRSGSPRRTAEEFDRHMAERARECADFYEDLAAPGLDPEARGVQQEALAGLEWNKQFYHYDVRKWLDGDPAFPPPTRRTPRNKQWQHFIAHDVISMPDDWEYPWFACWDLAFHSIPLSLSDPAAAKHQLKLLLKEWYMHPNGRLPAYEWNFGDPNPPVYAWAALRTYFADARQTGQKDRLFLEHVFHALLINFTWWANAASRDEELEVFGGGFLGLDNASPFNRSEPPPEGGYLVQSDGTSWMAMFALNMLLIALELARENIGYQPLAGKFLMHFLYISSSLDLTGCEGADLWDEADGFYYDQLHLPDGRRIPIKLRSITGLIPLFAVETVPRELAEVGRPLVNRWHWFLNRRPDMEQRADRWRRPNNDGVHLFSVLDRPKLERILAVLLDEKEFLGPFGIRSLSLWHRDHPYNPVIEGCHCRVDYTPGESTSGLFGGNSNWRGPVWMPVNHLIIESLRKYHTYYGDTLTAEFPTGSGRRLHLGAIADELTTRLASLFLPGADGRRPGDGGRDGEPRLFHEYFHADTGQGLGASHQTGWTACIADLLQRRGPT